MIRNETMMGTEISITVTEKADDAKKPSLKKDWPYFEHMVQDCHNYF